MVNIHPINHSIIYDFFLLGKKEDRRCVYEDGNAEDLGLLELQDLAPLDPENKSACKTNDVQQYRLGVAFVKVVLKSNCDFDSLYLSDFFELGLVGHVQQMFHRILRRNNHDPNIRIPILKLSSPLPCHSTIVHLQVLMWQVRLYYSYVVF